MNTNKFLTIVTLVAIVSLIASGCSEISYAAAPTSTPTFPTQTPVSQPMLTETAQPATLKADEAMILTLDELLGTWFNGNYLTFKSNGTYAVYDSLEAFQEGNSLDEGKYGVQGDQLWFEEMSTNCNGMGFYQLASKSQDALDFTKMSEACSRSVGKLQRVK